MPMRDIYGTAAEIEEHIPPIPSGRNYVDPWDLENYAYLRDHVGSPELVSDVPSDPSSLGDCVEAQSSFDYVSLLKSEVDTVTGRYESLITEQGTYAVIDELEMYDRKPQNELIYETGPKKKHQRHSETKNPLFSHQASSVYNLNRTIAKNKKHFGDSIYGTRDRSISFSYGDRYETFGPRSNIYNRLDDIRSFEDHYAPIKDIIYSGKPNFGLTNYGHLKIDYSTSWNNLKKYITS